MATDLKNIIKREYLKCLEDPIHFMRKYCTIQHPQRGKMKFDLYPFQEDCLKQFHKNRYNIILKSRQLGISTLSAGYSLWMILFHADKNVLVIATGKDTAKNLVTKVRVMFDGLPKWLRTNTEEINKLSIRLANGSQIKAIASNESAGRSEALSLLILDEAAFIEKVDVIWTASQQTLATGGDCIVLSTPNGVGNWFHQQWVGAEDGTNEFNTIQLHWSMHPERDQEWRDQQDIILGPSKASQECDADFLTSGESVVDPKILQWYKENMVKAPVEEQGIDRNLWIWEQPDYTKGYLVVGDVARSDGQDYSACQVFEISEMEQVAEYKGKITPKDFGNLLVAVATEYNDAIIIPDNSNIGWTTIQQIIDREYRNLFYMSKDLQYIDTMHQMTNKHYSEEKKMVPGFTISQKTRPLLIAKLEAYMREQSIIIRSSRMMTELDTFIWKNGKAEALGGYNDDLTLALAIGLWVRDTALRLRLEGIELNKQMLNNISGKYTKAVFTSDSQKEKDTWEIDVGQEKEDIRWLLG